ncbi:MAG: cytidine deaminase [Acidobacteriota bacterium]|nr:cytidine deaminase [Acidobacteriota bacterium]
MSGRTLAEVVTLPQGELIFALVAPTGTDFDRVQATVTDFLKQFGYDTNVIKLSGLAERLHTEQLGVVINSATEFERVNSRMSLGNKLRNQAGRGDILALHAISAISERRGEDVAPQERVVHLLRSLKHPEEVETLRRVYGTGFFLIGVYSPASKRLAYLMQRKGVSEEQAKKLLERDQDEADDALGQHTRDTFTLADVFVTEGKDDELSRFIDLVFGNPFYTPTQDEHSMFLAYAASLRSAQLARQVGAVVVSADGEVIATGANDVPKFRGGLYWPGPNDQRDHVRGFDANDRVVSEMIEDVVTRISGCLAEGTAEDARACLVDSRIADLTEFGRSVHAEMEALLSCARSGTRVKDGTLFTTTFPCHNCAKHIVAAGITRVVYVEPYPKSRALELHDDSIAVDNPQACEKVQFNPFVGIAARRYFDLFSMRLSSGLPLNRRRGSGAERAAVEWTRGSATPRIRLSPYSYLQREREAVALIDQAVTAMEQEPDRPMNGSQRPDN